MITSLPIALWDYYRPNELEKSDQLLSVFGTFYPLPLSAPAINHLGLVPCCESKEYGVSSSSSIFWAKLFWSKAGCIELRVKIKQVK